MPRLSTPRMVPMPSVMFLPGMKVPGGENTLIMPVRALGAPHTTCTGSPEPVSTMQTRRRSALGCCTAEITRAMVNGASAAALSATLSTSRPIMVSRSTSAASAASVSRCSLSQERVNFMTRPRVLPLPLAGEGWGGGARGSHGPQQVPVPFPCPASLPRVGRPKAPSLTLPRKRERGLESPHDERHDLAATA